jgi:hypothetical protein
MGRQELRLERALDRNVVPTVVVHDQELWIVEAHERVGIGNIVLCLGIACDVLGTPVLVIETTDHDRGMRGNHDQHAPELGAVVGTAALAGAMRARHLHPEEQAHLIG